jgi:hypothetical protein
MPELKHVEANPGDVLLLAGTTKGAFVLRSDNARDDWEVGGPYFPGRMIYPWPTMIVMVASVFGQQ